MKTKKEIYLVQRGKVNQNFDIHKDFGIMGPQGRFAQGEYMGAAEFEWGEIPASLKRIKASAGDYVLFKSTLLKHIDGRDVYIYCKKSVAPDLEEYLFNFIDNPSRTKEFTAIEYSLCQMIDGETIDNPNTSSFIRRLEKRDFWWCIDKNEEYEFGDWIMFCGDENTVNCFNRSMDV